VQAMPPPGFVHPAANVESPHVGPGTRIWAATHILPKARIGADCNIGENCFVENDVRIGNGVVIKNGVCLWDRIVIEDFVFVGPAVVFTNDKHPRAHPDYRTGPGGWMPTVIRTGASLGANSTILCGVEIGAWAAIGAGSVVTHDVPGHELWIGNPARFHAHVCRCGAPLRAPYKCACGEAYILADGALIPMAAK